MNHLESLPIKETEQKGAVVLFDVDNTLIKGFSIMLFADHLKRRGIITGQTYSQMEQDTLLYQNTPDTPEKYAKFAQEIVTHFYDGLRGLSADQIEAQGQQFLPEY